MSDSTLYPAQAPRYTSYPTAPAFEDSFGHADYAELLTRPRPADAPLSLYFHLPFCRNICLFCGCNVVYTANRSRMRPYLELLRQEMTLVSRHLRMSGPAAAEREVQHLHFGGGTPGFASPDELRNLHRAIREHFRLDPDSAEQSIELDPREATAEQIRALAACGFRRASLGIQDFDPQVQATIRREQRPAMVRELVRRLRASGFTTLSFDLIYGLPYQSLASLRTTIDRVLDLRPDRLSIFQFAYLPELKQHQRRLPVDALPDAPLRAELFESAREQLLAAGYHHTGMDHFARPDDELARAQRESVLHRNFQGYVAGPQARPDCDLLAFGISSIGSLAGRGESQPAAYVANTRDLNRYTEALRAERLPVARGLVLSLDDELRRHVIMELICHFQVRISAADRRRLGDAIARLEQEFVSRDLVETHTDADGMLQIRVLAAGRPAIRLICQVFDTYAERLRAKGQVFSQSA